MSRQKSYQVRKRMSGGCRQCGRLRLHDRGLCDKCRIKACLPYWTIAALKKHPELIYSQRVSISVKYEEMK